MDRDGVNTQQTGQNMKHLGQPIIFLATANADRSRKFYEELLGLEFVSDEPLALIFQVGQSMLRIQKVEKVIAAPYTALGWGVPDIRGTIRKLREAGVRFSRFEGMDQDSDGVWQSPAGALVAWFKDPDGHVLSLTEFS